jgi:hypothetical protein
MLERRPPLAGNDEVDPSAAALTADQPLVPVGDRHLGGVAFRHLGRVRLDLVPAIETPDDKPNARGRSVAERHRRATVGVHGLATGRRRVGAPPLPPLQCSRVGASGHELKHRLPNIASAGIVKGARWPTNTVPDRGPNPKKCLPLGQSESKHARETRVRRTDHMNKELSEDLRRSLTVVIGGTTIWTTSGEVIWKYQKRRG